MAQRTWPFLFASMGSLACLATAAWAQRGHFAGLDRGLLALAPGVLFVVAWGIVFLPLKRLPDRLQLVAACWSVALSLPAIVIYPYPLDAALIFYVGLVAVGIASLLQRLGPRQRLGVAVLAFLLGSLSLWSSLFPTLPIPTKNPGYGGVPGHVYRLRSSALRGMDDSALLRAAGEPVFPYAKRLNQVLFESLIHKGPKIDLRESWLIWLAAHTPWGEALADLRSPKLILRRGGGLCHQAALAYAEIATRAGLRVSVLGLGGHVGVLVQVGSNEYFFDPDYGVGGVRYPRVGEPPGRFEQELQERYQQRFVDFHHDAGLIELTVREIVQTASSLEDNLREPYAHSGPFLGQSQERLLLAQLIVSWALLLCSAPSLFGLARRARSAWLDARSETPPEAPAGSG